MGVSEKIMDALKAGILLNERVGSLVEKIDRIDQDVRQINGRLIRLETMVEIAKVQPKISE